MNDKKEVLGAAVNAKYLSSASPLTLRPTIRLYTTSTLVPYYAELSFNPYDAPADRDASSYPLPLVESVGPQQTQQQAAKPVLNKPVKLTQDGKMPVEVQEKTFLQKYWWIIAGGMMMLILGGGGGEEEGGK
ncbi:hypothetical protein BJ508DRAFT_418134 [Ascobolus immersus RN42]|uniref:ER membrane protein complex subunit 10 n=1 Tax=Ascobolus immersus RN42 TaxID=1160509 RepID=A0A3N4HU04_ASCIM|nr:hypothetical protein BJ508DRAFT_418134 [Ascobolus immersus RN42]